MDNTQAIPDSTPRDDSVAEGGRTEDQLLADIVRSSNFTSNEESLPTEQVPELDPEESDKEDPKSEESESEEVEEEVESEETETEGEDAAEEAATEGLEVFTQDDLDLDAKVAIKIDGKETEVSFSDLIKGYSTEQSLSHKGRELGEARKKLDEEYQGKFGELANMSKASLAVLYSTEQDLAKQYHDLDKDIDTARKDNDTFALSDLKDKREQAQKQYWDARNKREQLVSAVEKEGVEQSNKAWKEQLDYFNKAIPDMIPGFNEERAKSIREFAINEGISPEVLNSIADPKIVKFVDDYRILKQGINKGTVKRKATTVKKAPLRKAKTVSKKKEDANNTLRAKALSGNATQEEQNMFLRNIAERSLSSL
ncbi:MAG: hypothetical protein CMI75_08420 [Candidatus Pelagibacter sp.]|nr:hypothetical protein [Candidatus Pelagibacter sp.]|tara:strand:- start:3690 stop:4796 length:1107 start_codon:yes stop_codon:yes gene_type:complete